MEFSVAELLRASELPPIPRVGGPYLKPAINVYSFLEPLNANIKDPKTGIDLFGVCEFAANLNIDAVDLTGYFFPGYPKAPNTFFLNRIKRHTHRLGLDISGTGVRNDFATAIPFTIHQSPFTSTLTAPEAPRKSSR